MAGQSLGGRALLGWLEGEWSLRRAINGGQGSFEGLAELADDGQGGLWWRERGRLVLGGHDGPASRTLRVVPSVGGQSAWVGAEPGVGVPGARAGAWEVLFEDGRPFHSLDLSGGRCAVEHLCGEDLYSGEYVVDDDRKWSVRWWVRGPAKDDTIESLYRRVAVLR